MAAVVIGYTSTVLSVTEGDTATFSAQVMSGSLGDLAVRVVHSTQDGTATGTSHWKESLCFQKVSSNDNFSVATG